MKVHPSGYYAWRTTHLSIRQQEDRRLTGLIKQSWLESGGVYGYRKVTDDLRELGESCGKHRVYRLCVPSSCAPRRVTGGVPATATATRRSLRPTISNSGAMSRSPTRRGSPTSPTSGPTRVGCTWLSCSIFSRAKSSAGRCSLASTGNPPSLLMAVWRRQPKREVIVHSDQGSQFSSHDGQDFLKAHRLVASMSRRGNCYDNAVAESSFRSVTQTGTDSSSDLPGPRRSPPGHL